MFLSQQTEDKSLHDLDDIAQVRKLLTWILTIWHHEIFNKEFLFVLHVHVMVSLYSLQLFYFLIRT